MAVSVGTAAKEGDDLRHIVQGAEIEGWLSLCRCKYPQMLQHGKMLENTKVLCDDLRLVDVVLLDERAVGFDGFLIVSDQDRFSFIKGIMKWNKLNSFIVWK